MVKLRCRTAVTLSGLELQVRIEASLFPDLLEPERAINQQLDVASISKAEIIRTCMKIGNINTCQISPLKPLLDIPTWDHPTEVENLALETSLSTSLEASKFGFASEGQQTTFRPIILWIHLSIRDSRKDLERVTANQIEDDVVDTTRTVIEIRC